MSTYQSRRVGNRATAKLQAADAFQGESPTERMAALEALEQSMPPTGQTVQTPHQSAVRTSGGGDAGQSLPTEDVVARATHGSPNRVTAPSTPSSRRAGESLVDALLTRAPRRTEKSSGINVSIPEYVEQRLVKLEEYFFLERSERLVRTALLLEATNRVCGNAKKYMPTKDDALRGKTITISGRIPDATHRKLSEVGYLAKPRISFSPLVVNALIEIVGELDNYRTANL